MINRRDALVGALALVPATASAQIAGIECCQPTRRALHVLRALHRPVAEVGPGTGYWLEPMRKAGVEVVGGWDIRPRGPGVTKGDHLDAAAAAPEGAALLAVWPPDGTAIQAWVGARDWAALAILGDYDRLSFGGALAAYRVAETLQLPESMWGANTLKIFQRV